MIRTLRPVALAAAMIVAGAPSSTAQQPAAARQPAASGLAADLLTDVEQVEKKLLGLARAIPADKYDWRPGEGVRSVGEVLLHVAADNYLLPAAMGAPAEASTGIKAEDYNTVLAYERRKLNKDATITELERSFAYMKRSLSAIAAPQLGEKVTMFGQSFTRQQAWILTATHIHEHLGQMIAYARSNGIAPPWS